MINNFEKLQVLQIAHNFVIKVYKIAQALPSNEKYRLVDQICRSSSSVPANIVEGNSRHGKKEFIQYLYQAKGSLAETQYHLLLARDLNMINEQDFKSLISDADRVGMMISGLIKYLKAKS